MDFSDSLDDFEEQIARSAEMDANDYLEDCYQLWSQLPTSSNPTPNREISQQNDGLAVSNSMENIRKQAEIMANLNSQLVSERGTLEIRLHSTEADLNASHELVHRLALDLRRKSVETATLNHQIQWLYRQLQELHSTSPYWMQAGECVVCLTNLRKVMLMPCMHLCVCDRCSVNLEKCPLCREDALARIRPYA